MDWKDPLIEAKIRIDRGNALVYWVRNLIIIVAAIKYLFNFSLPILVLSGLCVIISFYVIGWIDLNFLKINQREQQLVTEKYNYYFKNLKEIVVPKNRKI